MSKITEGTLVPLSVIGSIAVVSVGTIMWLTTIFIQGNATAAEVKDLKQRVELKAEVLYEIDKRLARIEDKLGVKK